MSKVYPERESKSLELKRDLVDSFLKSVSAFANFGTGKVIFGVSDDGTVTGVTNGEKLKLQIENKINDSISPIPEFQLAIVEFHGQLIVELTVFKGMHAPYLYGGRSYKRSDTSSIALDSSEMRRISIESSGLTFDQLPSQETKLSFKILQKGLMESVGLKNLNEDSLRSLGLMKGERYLRSAELLADINQNTQSTTVIIRFGKTTSEFLDRVDLSRQSLLSQYDGALKMFDKWYAPYEVVDGAKRVTRIQIPKEAYREAVANALIHRRYDLNGAVQIAMYQDRIDVTSPGGLPEGISESAYLYSQISIPRNLIIAEVFHRLHIIEKFGTGIERIRREYELYADNPQFDISNDVIRVVLPVINHKKQSKDLSSEERILLFVGQNPMVARSELEIISSLQRTRLTEVLNKLVQEGKLERFGAGRGVRYKIKLQ